jgi:hypothetical protein
MPAIRGMVRWRVCNWRSGTVWLGVTDATVKTKISKRIGGDLRIDECFSPNRLIKDLARAVMLKKRVESAFASGERSRSILFLSDAATIKDVIIALHPGTPITSNKRAI